MVFITEGFFELAIESWPVIFINESKACEISYQMFFKVLIFENKRQTSYDIDIAK